MKKLRTLFLAATTYLGGLQAAQADTPPPPPPPAPNQAPAQVNSQNMDPRFAGAQYQTPPPPPVMNTAPGYNYDYNSYNYGSPYGGGYSAPNEYYNGYAGMTGPYGLTSYSSPIDGSFCVRQGPYTECRRPVAINGLICSEETYPRRFIDPRSCRRDFTMATYPTFYLRAWNVYPWSPLGVNYYQFDPFIGYYGYGRIGFMHNHIWTQAPQGYVPQRSWGGGTWRGTPPLRATPPSGGAAAPNPNGWRGAPPSGGGAWQQAPVTPGGGWRGAPAGGGAWQQAPVAPPSGGGWHGVPSGGGAWQQAAPSTGGGWRGSPPSGGGGWSPQRAAPSSGGGWHGAPASSGGGWRGGARR
jgi:hypothetical protein